MLKIVISASIFSKIRTKRAVAVLIILLPFLACTSKQQEPVNLHAAKKAVADYYESGAYSAELKSEVQQFIQELESSDLPENPAVIFDVDETVLSNYDYIKSLNFGYEYNLWNEYQKTGTAKAIPEVKELYNYLKEKGFKIIFLTARRQVVYESTLRNLTREGFTDFDTLICYAQDHKDISSADFKGFERELLTNSGVNIAATVGDQNSDFSGGNTGLSLKLPNLLYQIK